MITNMFRFLRLCSNAHNLKLLKLGKISLINIEYAKNFIDYSGSPKNKRVILTFAHLNDRISNHKNQYNSNTIPYLRQFIILSSFISQAFSFHLLNSGAELDNHN